MGRLSSSIWAHFTRSEVSRLGGGFRQGPYHRTRRYTHTFAGPHRTLPRCAVRPHVIRLGQYPVTSDHLHLLQPGRNNRPAVPTLLPISPKHAREPSESEAHGFMLGPPNSSNRRTTTTRVPGAEDVESEDHAVFLFRDFCFGSSDGQGSGGCGNAARQDRMRRW